MNKQCAFLLGFLLIVIQFTHSQELGDSIVLFKDLKFHSDLEKSSLQNFVRFRKDSLKLFLAIDKRMNDEMAFIYQSYFECLYNQKILRKAETENICRKEKQIQDIVKQLFLKQYKENQFFPSIFENGNYNCVSKSILLGMVYNKLNIPYKIMVSPQHVYIQVCDKNKSKKGIGADENNGILPPVTDKFKKQFIKNLKDLKIVHDKEMTEEYDDVIFESFFTRAKEAQFSCLPGLQYYNRAVLLLQSDNFKEAYEYAQKAYFFFPATHVKILLFQCLSLWIDKCVQNHSIEFESLVQLSRFDHVDTSLVSKTFQQIILYKLKFEGRGAYCDSLYKNLYSHLNNPKIRDEITFEYYGLLCDLYSRSEKLDLYSYQVLKVRPESKAAYSIFEYALQKKYEQIFNVQVLLDTVMALKQRYKLEVVRKLVAEYEMIANLGMAFDNFKKKKPEIAEQYLLKFENAQEIPVDKHELTNKIEDAYRAKAEYYSNRNRAKSNEALKKGLNYVPNSSILKVLLQGNKL
jgi:hypothetical protein